MIRRWCGLAVALLVAVGPLRAQQRPADDRLVIRQLEFTGNRALSTELLAASIVTTNSAFLQRYARFLGFGERRRFDEEEFVRDVLRMKLLYRVSGFPDAVVDTVVRRDLASRSVYITIRLVEGAPVLVTDFTVTGLDSLPADVRRAVTLDLPLRVGAPFDRLKLQASVDTITRRLRNTGYPEAEVFREFTSDVPSRRASVTLAVVTGPFARLGPVRVEGVTRLDSAVVRNLVGVRPGDPYREEAIYQGQRYLYRADLFRLASITVDSILRQPGDSVVPLLVRVTEAPPRRLRGGVGFGTTDCFRANTGLTVRNFLGGGRILDVSARVSKVGVGGADLGLENTICSALRQDVGSSRLNYTVQASYRRPAFLAPENTLTLGVFSERRSEFGVYLREDLGASLVLQRDHPRERVPISLAYTIAYGRTEALPAAFCAALSACTPEIIALQQQRRVLGTVTATLTLPRANNAVDPTRGSNSTFEVTRSDTWLGSSSLQRFTRFTGDVAFYRPLTRTITISWRLRGGLIFAPPPPDASLLGAQQSSFVPLEQRFYGGGPNDVRGFQRNELGPVVYVAPESTIDSAGAVLDTLSRSRVRFSATGGNSVGVGNIELRLPSPIFPDRMRLAAFVDAGAVWNRGEGEPPAVVRFTPGAGIRFATPLGPLRFDVAYNSNPPEAGRLFAADAAGNLRLVQSDFRFARPRTFTFHVNVGQPF